MIHATPPTIITHDMSGFGIGCYDPEVSSDDGKHCITPTPTPIPVYTVQPPSLFCGLSDDANTDNWEIKVKGEGQSVLGVIRCKDGNLTLLRFDTNR